MLQTERLILQSRRPFILVAVAFWWGGVLALNLVSLAFPELLPPTSIPDDLDPDSEGTIVNAVSAGTLLIAALLALANAVLRSRSFASVGGWAVLGMTCVYLAWEELTDFHVVGVVPIRRAVFSDDLFYSAGVYLWVVLASPLIAAFVLSMGIFVRKSLHNQETRLLFVLGLAAWVLALAYEASYPFLFLGRADALAILLEETLEFGGTLLFILSATTVLQQDTCAAHKFPGCRPRMLAAGSLVAVGIFCGLVVSFVFRAPVIDARATTHIDSFHISLTDGESLVQDLDMPDIPIGRFMLRLINDDPESRIASVKLRLKDLEYSESILREGQVEVTASSDPQWVTIDFPSLAVSKGQLLAVQVVADLARGAELRIVGTKTNQNQRGGLSINGSPAWPDQAIEYMVYGAPEPTLSKLQAIQHTLASGWHWPVLAAGLALALAFAVFIPAVLLSHSLPQRPA